MDEDIFTIIKHLATQYSAVLKRQLELRENEMADDDTSHFLIYRVLGIPTDEGHLIDLYQNKGRFLYKYAGAFLEEAAITCLKHKFPNAEKAKIPNTHGRRPKTYEIDCLIGDRALEIKWRDATTDGDHITKEHARVLAIREKGYHPVRIMFYYPQRKQAQRIQETLKTLYNGIGGEYFYGDDAWRYLCELTGIDLLEILRKIADSRGVV